MSVFTSFIYRLIDDQHTATMNRSSRAKVFHGKKRVESHVDDRTSCVV